MNGMLVSDWVTLHEAQLFIKILAGSMKGEMEHAMQELKHKNIKSRL